MTQLRALPLATADLDVDDIVRTIEWHDSVKDVDSEIYGITMTVLELLVFVSAGSRHFPSMMPSLTNPSVSARWRHI